ncbi:MAG: sugar-binding protein [Clostridiales bacterium]|nr:sugar-binding protein [Clostridiales bacterium]
MSSFTSGMGSKKVGISMPTKDLQRWNQDGDLIKKTLEAAGYEADLQYANNKVDVQISQIEDMINTGCKVLIIAAIEGNSLGTVLEKANKSGVTVIAYDRPIMDSDCVDYYISFDNYLVGQIQGEYVRNALSLDSTSGPYYIEFTAGDPGDNFAAFFYNGAMDVLRPYIDSGKLIVASGQTDFDSVATPKWSTETAQARAENIIYSCYMYPTVNIDAWLCSNDSTAWGVVNALDSTYTGSWPVITGMDCDIVNVKYIIGGKQAMSVFKDTRTLAVQAARMAGQILEGDNVAVNSSSYNNSIDIPTFLCEPVFADINNYKAILIDSGYYTEAELT